MHILLTDRLTCPRCGPGFGLILLADDLAERRVRSGALGCPNCRDRYPVSEGVADLRPPPRGTLRAAGGPPAPAEEAARVGAALGLRPGPGATLAVGRPTRTLEHLSKLEVGGELVAVGLDGIPAAGVGAAASRIVVRSSLPFRDGSITGVVTDPNGARILAGELVRVVAPGGRLAVMGGVATDLEPPGWATVVRDADTVVWSRPAGGA